MPAHTRRRSLIVVVTLGLAIAAAWIVQSVAAEGEQGAEAPAEASVPSYTVAVTQGGRLLERFTIADLQELPSIAMDIDGKQQSGPTVATVLVAANAGTFETLSVRGIGARDSGRLTLESARVDDRLLLDFSDRGTVKVCSPDLQWHEWVRDVVQLELD